VQSRALTLLPVGNVLIALIVVLLAIQVARLFWVVVIPVGPLAGWRAPSVSVVSPSARLALFRGFDPFYRTDAPAATTQNVTSLSLVLFGVRHYCWRGRYPK
jgi:general secretion pathway protein C